MHQLPYISQQVGRQASFKSDLAQSAVQFEQCVHSRFLPRRCHAKTQRRLPKETRSILASLTNRCTATKYAYDQAVQRNSHLAEAHRLLSGQYQQLAQELSVLAGRHRLLQREMTDMQTDALAHEAIMCQYERRLVVQQATISRQRDPDRETKILLAKISELQEEKADIYRAFVSASERLAASPQMLQPAHGLGTSHWKSNQCTSN